MDNLFKLIKDYQWTRKKNEYFLILLEKSRKLKFPTYSLIQLLNSINRKNTEIISSEGWVEKDSDLETERKVIEKEKAELKKARAEFENGKIGKSLIIKKYFIIFTVAAIILVIFYIAPGIILSNDHTEDSTSIERANMNPSKIDSNGDQFKGSDDFKNDKSKHSPLTQKEYDVEEKLSDLDVAKVYFTKANDKLQNRDYEAALSLIDAALKHNPHSMRYTKFKSDLKHLKNDEIEKNAPVDQAKTPVLKTVDEEMVEIVGDPEPEGNFHEDKQVEREPIIASIPTSKANAVKTTSTTKNVKKEVLKDNISFAIVEEVPFYPVCKGSNSDKKNCTINEITKYVNRKIKLGFAGDLGLTPGKKRIYVQFKIDKTGEIVSVKARGPHERLEKEAIRVVQSLPKMNPGKQGGRIVNVNYTLPITVIIK